MKAKKSKRANLENKKMIFLQSGLIIALGLILVAFEWTSEFNRSELVYLHDFDPVEEIGIINTFPPKPPAPKPKPQPIKLVITDILEIDEELDLDLFDSEINEGTFVPTYDVYTDEDDDDSDPLPFVSIEDKPEFPGGQNELLRYLAKATKYPEQAKEAGISGRVYVNFVIDKKGKVTNVSLLRGVHPLLDNEAIRVVKSMPAWKPGKQRNKPVKVLFNVPISFRLQ